jgi:assimilatory nitrate reductase catalytic subunit
MTPKVTSTTCPYCGVGCGVQAAVASDGKVTVAGDPMHPSNFGRLCVKGSALGETVGLEGRLLNPMQRTEDGLHPISWDAAMDTVASGLRRIIDIHGPDAIALYVSGQLLTEDYYVANKLMKGYVGSANIDTNSRLCMSSAVAGHKRAFGEDLVPVSYADLEVADLIVLVGSNTAWCHPILFQRIAKMREARPSARMVVIDPRRTATCELADLHLPVKAGTDVWLFNGLLSYLTRSGAVDTTFVDAHTAGWKDTVAAANVDCSDPAEVARVCEIDLDVLLDFYRMFADTDRTITAFSQGVNQSSAGTDKVNAIINCHLATGRIGRPGAGPFSITGQPNAMGGREVGGLANMLAAHLDLDKADHRDLVQTFWSSPAIASRPGLKAVDLFHAIDHRNQPSGEPARCRPGQARAGRMRTGDRVGRHGRDRHQRLCRRAAARAGLGRERRNGYQFRTPHLPSACFLARTWRGTCGLAGAVRRGHADGLRRLQLCRPACDL